LFNRNQSILEDIDQNQGESLSYSNENEKNYKFVHEENITGKGDCHKNYSFKIKNWKRLWRVFKLR